MTWSEISSPTTKDWLGLYVQGAPDADHGGRWLYTSSCSKVAGTTALSSGTCSYTLPSTLAPGTYEVRLFRNNSYTRVSVSNALSVEGGTPTSTPAAGTATPTATSSATPTLSATMTLQVSLTRAPASSAVDVQWSTLSSPTTKDWLGLYVQGAPDADHGGRWLYTSSCSKVAGTTALSSGTCSYTLPSTLAPGTYEVRLFRNDGFTRVPTTSPTLLTVTGPVLQVSPASVQAGSSVSVQWQNVSSATVGDWLGLYVQGAPDADHGGRWLYTSSCSKVAGTTALSSGTCSYTLPSTLAPGTYEVRLFRNNSYTRVSAPTPLSVGVVPRTHDTSPSTPWTQFSADVNVVGGNLVRQAVDLEVPSIGFGTSVGRTYNSVNSSVNGLLGYGWFWSYGLRVVAASGAATVVREDGRADTYLQTEAGYTAPSGIDDRLEQESDGTWRLTRRDQVHYVFSATGQLRQIGDENGNVLQVTYTNGLPSRVTDTAGRNWIIAVDNAGRINRITDPVGREVVYQYNALGELAQVTDALEGSTQYRYDEGHRLTQVTDPLGRSVQYSYGVDGRVTTLTDPDGNVTNYAYDASALRTAVTNALTKTTIFAYDDASRVTSVTDPLSKTTSSTWDAQNRRVAVTDPNGRKSTFVYDARGNVTESTDAKGGQTTATFDAGNRPTSRTDALGRTTTYTYDARGNLTEVAAPGARTSHTYDSRGQRVSTINPNSRTTRFTYDNYGNRISITDALDNSTTYTYDAAGRILSETDPEGRVTQRAYDALGRVLATTDGAGGVSTATYDAAGNRLTAIDPLGNKTTFTYGARNELLRVTDALGKVTIHTYDAVGNRVSTRDPLGNMTRFTYDPNRRLLTTTDPNDLTTTHAYDGVGNQISVTDPLGRTTSFEYDGLNRLVGVTDAMSGKASYAYDAVGNRIGVTDPNGNTTGVVYDKLNRPESDTDPLSHNSRYVYDPAGNLLSKVDANGGESSFTYDPLNRLTSAVYPEGSVTYAYDRAGNRISMTDQTGTTTYSYDGAGRLTSNAAPGGTTTYSYDGAGNLKTLTYPGGDTVTYGYDALNRVVSVTDWNGQTSSFSYDAAGRKATASQPNGTGGTFSYDAAGRITGIQWTGPGGTALLGISYTYDAAGNRIKVVDATGTAAFEYDKLDRLTKAAYGDGTSASYAYDAAGNRLSVTMGTGDKTVYSYDAANRLKDVTTYAYDAASGLRSLGTDPVAWDANGNQISRGATTYQYDSQNRLIEVAKPAQTVRMAYDGANRRVTRSVDGNATSFQYDEHAKLARVVKESNSQRSQLYGLDGQVLWNSTSDQGKLYYHQDALGSTVALTKPDGTLAGTRPYDAFGAPKNGTAQPGSFWFAGEQYDPEEGLIYLRARNYDPSTGRFLQVDPMLGDLRDTQSLNPYVYARNNPLSYTDPTGEVVIDSWGKLAEAWGSFGLSFVEYDLVKLVNVANTVRELREYDEELQRLDEIYRKVQSSSDWELRVSYESTYRRLKGYTEFKKLVAIAGEVPVLGKKWVAPVQAGLLLGETLSFIWSEVDKPVPGLPGLPNGPIGLSTDGTRISYEGSADVLGTSTASSGQRGYQRVGRSPGRNLSGGAYVPVTQPITHGAAYVGEGPPYDTDSVPAGTTFEKQWTLRNSGTATWTTSGYRARRTSGIFGPETLPLSGDVGPGATVAVSGRFTPPSTLGTYRATYRMEGPTGLFGAEFWVQVTTTPANFTTTPQVGKLLQLQQNTGGRVGSSFSYPVIWTLPAGRTVLITEQRVAEGATWWNLDDTRNGGGTGWFTYDGAPPPPAPGEVIVDDTSGGFARGGPYWRESGIGYNGHSWWTFVNGNVVSSWGDWSANLTGGSYEVYAWIPRDNGTAQQARYELSYQGGTTSRTVNQAAYFDTWVSLGTYSFPAGTTRQVRLTDATGESGGTYRKVNFDAIKFVPRESTPPPPAVSEVIVDNASGGFAKGGPYWWGSTIGYNGHSWWTFVNGNVVSSWGDWSANLAGGSYEVFAWIPSQNAWTQKAPYDIYHQGGTTRKLINQEQYNDEWVSLGTYSFPAGTSRQVHLTDATGESYSVAKRQVNFDAIKFVPVGATCPTGQYKAEYFNNMSVSGSPVFTRCEGAPVAVDWGAGGPGNGVANDGFSVRWTGRFSFEAATYTFVNRADDGIRTWVDGNILIDAWRDQGPTEYRANSSLAAGEHSVRVEYYENGGGAVAEIRWEKAASPPPRSEVIVDDTSGGFVKGGPYWWGSTIGYNGHSWWTFVNGNVVSSWGDWSANLAGGSYEVFAWIPSQNAWTQKAPYDIYHQGGTTRKLINQEQYNDEWVSLGTYSFPAGTSRQVHLTDATGESYSVAKRQVNFDAIRFVPR